MKSYQQIDSHLARQIKLIMTDVDGTITSSDDSISPVIYELIQNLKDFDINIGLVSGRSLPGLEKLARDLKIEGPIIGEHGGVAKPNIDEESLELGYSREASIEAFNQFQELYPDKVRRLHYNKNRLVDIVFEVHGISIKELRSHLNGVELVDSGYMFHLLPEGVNKGTTLMRLLNISGNMTPVEVMVIGDFITDLSLFQLFPNSVLVANPKLPHQQRCLLESVAKFSSDQPYSDGFIEVINHLLELLVKKQPGYYD